MPDYHDSSMHQQSRLDSLSLDVIQEYFAKLNPIAQRIAYDIRDTQVNYGKLWDTLNYHEQNDIINDTLIKPEISLHYFDNFPTPTQSASSKSSTSTDSLAAIVLNDFGKLQDDGDDARKSKQVLPLKQFDAKYNINDDKDGGYAFDGRNLGTYSMQTVALKIIQDDALGRFRDEHSRPFSYRTKSQINLHVFHSNAESPSRSDRRAIEHFPLKSLPASKEQTSVEPIDPESRKALLNYQRLQCELKKSLNHNLQKTRPAEVQKLSNINIKPSTIASPPSESSYNRKTNAKHETVATNSGKDKNASNIKPKTNKSSSSLIQVFLNSNNSSAPSSSTVVNYAVYTDAFLDGEEKANLMQHCGRGEFMSASSSSAATSEDDEYDIRTDKAQDSEEVFLLDNDLNMRKGFDFLNNW